MKIHREGYPTLILVLTVLLVLNLILYYFATGFSFLTMISLVASLLIFLFFLQFFRLPRRVSQSSQNEIICPADGEVVVIEETNEDEYLKEKRIQVSIFMSPFNVHANWYPISGKVKYVQYHPGKFLVAWHPKSSTLNERSTVVVESNNGMQILVRQIAGAVARRIVTYSKAETLVQKNQELGYIKFGSRVDIFLPLGTKIMVNLKDKVIGNQTILAKLM
jgi:phosphatidylserine decarboxylase